MSKQQTALEALQQQMKLMNEDIEELKAERSESRTESGIDDATYARQETDKLSMNTSQERFTEYESNAPSTHQEVILKKPKNSIISKQNKQHSTIQSKPSYVSETNTIQNIRSSQVSSKNGLKRNIDFHNRGHDDVQSNADSKFGADSEAASLKQLRKVRMQRKENSGDTASHKVLAGSYTTDRSNGQKEDKFFARPQSSKRPIQKVRYNEQVQYVTDAQTRNWQPQQSQAIYGQEDSKFHTENEGEGRLQYYNQRRPQSGYKNGVQGTQGPMTGSRNSFIQPRNQRKSVKRVYGQQQSVRAAQGMLVSKSHRKLVRAGASRKSSKEKALGLEQFYQGGYISHATGFEGKPYGSLMKKKKTKSKKRIDNFVENHPIADSINIKVFSSDVDQLNGGDQKEEYDEENDEEEDQLLAYYAKKFQARSLMNKSPGRGGGGSISRSTLKEATIDVEQLENDLKNHKLTANRFVEENKKLKTFNRQLQKEIYNNERVIEVIMKKMANVDNRTDRTSASNLKRSTQHFGMMVQCKAQIREYKIENQRLIDQMEKMKKNVGLTSSNEVISENQQLKYHIKAMSDTLIKMQKQIHHLKTQKLRNSETSLNNSKLLEFEEVAKTQQQRIEKLQDQCYELKKKGEARSLESDELSRVKKECEAFKNDKMNFELELKQIKDDHEREFYPTKQALENTQSSLQDKTIQIEQLELALSNANTSLKNANTNFEQAQANIQKLEQLQEFVEAGNSQMNVKGSAKSDKSMKILEAAQNKVEQLEAFLKTAQNEVQELKALLNINSESLETSNNKVKILTKALDDQQITEAQKNEELKSLSEELEKLKADQESKTLEYSVDDISKKDASAEVQEQNAKLQNDLARIQGKNASLEMQIQTLNQEVTQIKSSCESQKQDAKYAWELNEQKDVKIQEQIDQVSNLEKDIEMYKTMIQQKDELKAGGDSISDSQDQLTSSMNEFMEQKKVLEQEITSLKQQIGEQSKKLSHSENLFNEANDKLIEQETSLIQMQSRLNKQKTYISKVEEDANHNYYKMQSMRNEMSDDGSYISTDQDKQKADNFVRQRSGSKKKVEFALEEDENVRHKSIEKQESQLRTMSDFEKMSKELQDKEKIIQQLMASKNVGDDLQKQLNEREQKIKALTDENSSMLGQVTNLSEWRSYLEERINSKRDEVKQLKRYARDLKSKSREPTFQPQNSIEEAKQIDLANQRELQDEIKEDMIEGIQTSYDKAVTKKHIDEITNQMKKQLEQKDSEIYKLKTKIQEDNQIQKDKSKTRMDAIKKTDAEFLAQIDLLQIKCEKEIANSQHWCDQSKKWKEQFEQVEAKLKISEQDTPSFTTTKLVEHAPKESSAPKLPSESNLANKDVVEAIKQKDLLQELIEKKNIIIDQLVLDEKQLRSDLDAANQQVKTLSETLKSKSEVPQEAKSETNEVQEQLMAKEQQLTTLSDQLLTAQSELRQMSDMSKEIDDQIQLTRAEWEKNKQEQQQKIDELESQLKSHQENLQEKAGQTDKNQETMTYLLQNNENQIKELKSKLEETLKYKTQLESSMIANEEALKPLQEANKQQIIEIQEHLSTIKQKQIEKEQVKNDAKEVAQARDQLLKQVEEIQKENTSLKEQAAKVSLEKGDQMDSIEVIKPVEVKKSISKKLKEIEEYFSEEETPVSDEQIEEKKLEKQGTMISKAPSSIQKIQKQKTKSLDSEVKELQQKIKNYIFNNEKYGQELQDAKDRNEQLEIKHNKDMFKNTQHLQKQLMQQEENHNSQLLKEKKDQQKQIERIETHWKSKMDQVMTDMNKLQGQNESLKRDLQRLQNDQKLNFGRKNSANDQSMNYSLTDNNNTLIEGSPEQENLKSQEIVYIDSTQQIIQPNEILQSDEKQVPVEETNPSDSQALPSSSFIIPSSSQTSKSPPAKKGRARPTSAHPKGRGKSGLQSGTDDEYQTSALISGSEAYATGNEDLKEIDEISDYDEELEKNAIILDKFAENFGSDSQQSPKKK